MSLKAFHVVFISASVLLAFALAAWCFGAGELEEGAPRTAAGVAAVAAGLGLLCYEAWFVRKMRRLS
jgi:hypothetical protein